MKTIYRTWIGKRLKHFRELRKHSQSQISNLIDIKLCTYQSYEEGRAEPSIFTLKMFCKICKVKMDKFLQDSPEKKTPAY